MLTVLADGGSPKINELMIQESLTYTQSLALLNKETYGRLFHKQANCPEVNSFSTGKCLLEYKN